MREGGRGGRREGGRAYLQTVQDVFIAIVEAREEGEGLVSCR